MSDSRPQAFIRKTLFEAFVDEGKKFQAADCRICDGKISDCLCPYYILTTMRLEERENTDKLTSSFFRFNER